MTITITATLEEARDLFGPNAGALSETTARLAVLGTVVSAQRADLDTLAEMTAPLFGRVTRLETQMASLTDDTARLQAAEQQQEATNAAVEQHMTDQDAAIQTAKDEVAALKAAGTDTAALEAAIGKIEANNSDLAGKLPPVPTPAPADGGGGGADATGGTAPADGSGGQTPVPVDGGDGSSPAPSDQTA